MRNIALPVMCLFVLSMTLIACSRGRSDENSQPAIPKQTPATVPAGTPDADLSRLIGRIWRISSAPFGSASGSIYVFLPNGTLLEASCVESYRIATWVADKNEPGVLQVVEDGRPAFTAKVGASADKALHLQQTLLMGNKERRDLTLTAVEQEFVCPDLRKQAAR